MTTTTTTDDPIVIVREGLYLFAYHGATACCPEGAGWTDDPYEAWNASHAPQVAARIADRLGAGVIPRPAR